MAEQYINELEINGQKRLDLTQDTATPETVLEGETFHLRSGAPTTGTYRPSDEIEARLRATVGHSSKNLLDFTKYAASTDVTDIVIDPETGSVSANASGTYKTVYFNDENIHFENGKTYVISCKNNAVNAGGSLSIRRRVTFNIYESASFNTLGVKSITFTPNTTDFPNGWMISLFITNASGADSSIDISDLMMREVSISDDTFEPYVTPTDERVSSTDERVSSLDIAAANVSQYVPDPDEGIYWITIIDHYSTQNNRFDIYISTPNSDGGYFFGASESYPIPEHEVKLPHFHSYKGNAISFGIIAGTTDQVMAISSKPGIFSPSHSTSMWDKIFDFDTFLDFCDVKDGNATNYMHIHLCKDGGIRSQAEYEAYISG